MGVKRFDSINVIPFIDIMLVLLAIVLTTASFIAQGKITIELPAAKSSVAESDISVIEISINQQRNIYINDEEIVLAELQQRLVNIDKLSRIVLRVDANVPFESFIAVVDRLKVGEFQNLTIKTRRMK